MDDLGNRQGEFLGLTAMLLLALCVLAVVFVLVGSQLGASRVSSQPVANAATPAGPVTESPETAPTP